MVTITLGGVSLPGISLPPPTNLVMYLMSYLPSPTFTANGFVGLTSKLSEPETS